MVNKFNAVIGDRKSKFVYRCSFIEDWGSGIVYRGFFNL